MMLAQTTFYYVKNEFCDSSTPLHFQINSWHLIVIKSFPPPSIYLSIIDVSIFFEWLIIYYYP